MKDTGDDEPEFERRRVLSGIGGVVATGAFAGPASALGSPDDLADEWAERFAGVSTASDREELAHLVGELRTDAEILAGRDFEDLGDARRAEFAAKGGRLRNMMAGECGYEGYEIWGGPIDDCCAAHDICETYNNKPDSVFNGDDCDGMFWSCASASL